MGQPFDDSVTCRSTDCIARDAELLTKVGKARTQSGCRRNIEASSDREADREALIACRALVPVQDSFQLPSLLPSGAEGVRLLVVREASVSEKEPRFENLNGNREHELQRWELWPRPARDFSHGCRQSQRAQSAGGRRLSLVSGFMKRRSIIVDDEDGAVRLGSEDGFRNGRRELEGVLPATRASQHQVGGERLDAFAQNSLREGSEDLVVRTVLGAKGELHLEGTPPKTPEYQSSPSETSRSCCCTSGSELS